MLLYRKFSGASRWVEPSCRRKSRGSRAAKLGALSPAKVSFDDVPNLAHTSLTIARPLVEGCATLRAKTRSPGFINVIFKQQNCNQNQFCYLGVRTEASLANIQLENISKSYGTNLVLKNVSLTVEDREFLTLVGPSGCGKSTLLRVIAGLEAPESGSVAIDGRLVTKTAPALRNLAMVFQSYALYPHLSVRENMKTPLKLRDLSFTERLPLIGRFIAPGKHQSLNNQVEETASTLRINEYLERRPGQLSGGQRQRAALGRAMVRTPLAFLMDEPLSNLDAALRVHMRAELSELHRNLETTFVYVTHDQSEALTMSDRVAVMMDGDIVQIGTPEEIYNQPEFLSVAEFLGSPKINRLELNDELIVKLKMPSKAALLKADIDPTLIKHVCFRPEHVSLSNAKNTPEAVVRHIENLGSEFFVHAELAVTGCRIILKLDAPTGSAINIGEVLRLSINPNAMLFFDESGNRIRARENMEDAAA